MSSGFIGSIGRQQGEIKLKMKFFCDGLFKNKEPAEIKELRKKQKYGENKKAALP